MFRRELNNSYFRAMNLNHMETENIIRFETKEAANDRRLKETLGRTPHERLMFFLKLSQEMQFFSRNEDNPNRAKNNYILE